MNPKTTIEYQTLKNIIADADAILIGAGAGLSASAGYTYSGERFERYFSDFKDKYGISDMYSGGFYPYKTLEEHWAYWSRYIYINRFMDAPKPVYQKILEFVKNKDYFVLTTNVDHCFQKAGFDKKRLFYTQGDFGLFQCSAPCHSKTYDNEEVVRQMFAEQKEMRVPCELIPLCPHCGKPMTMNLRADDKFVQDDGWYRAVAQYQSFVKQHEGSNIVYLELGVGMNTPVIIKYNFWEQVAKNPKARYICINKGQAFVPYEIEKQSVCLDSDIGEVINELNS